MFLEHNGYVGRLPALMSAWQHRKRRATQTVKISAFTRSWRRGDTHRGTQNSAVFCMTPQSRLSQTREHRTARQCLVQTVDFRRCGPSAISGLMLTLRCLGSHGTKDTGEISAMNLKQPG